MNKELQLAQYGVSSYVNADKIVRIRKSGDGWQFQTVLETGNYTLWYTVASTHEEPFLTAVGLGMFVGK